VPVVPDRVRPAIRHVHGRQPAKAPTGPTWLLAFPHQRSWDTVLRYGSTLGGEETSIEEAVTMLVLGMTSGADE
jgi:hypothetical protein